jgi:hypothetical protein
MGRLAAIILAAMILFSCTTKPSNDLSELGWGMTLEQLKQRHSKIDYEVASDDETRVLVFNVEFGGEPAFDYAAFASGRAKLIKLEFYIVGHWKPPGLSPAECEVKFQRIAAQFERVFGAAGELQTRRNDFSGVATMLSWRSATTLERFTI